MTKQTKMLLGVGAVAVVGYLVWKKMSGTKANASGMTSRGTMAPKKGKCKTYLSNKLSTITEDGKTYQAYPCLEPKGAYSTTPPDASDNR